MSTPSHSRAITVGYALLNLLIAAAVAFGAFQIANAAVGATRGGKMLVGATLPVKLQISPRRVRLPPGLRHDGWVTTTVQVQSPTGAQEALAAAIDVTQLVLFIAVFWLLRGIELSVKKGDPFGPDNARRLRGTRPARLDAPRRADQHEPPRGALRQTLGPEQSAGLGTAGYTIPGPSSSPASVRSCSPKCSRTASGCART